MPELRSFVNEGAGTQPPCDYESFRQGGLLSGKHQLRPYRSSEAICCLDAKRRRLEEVHPDLDPHTYALAWESHSMEVATTQGPMHTEVLRAFGNPEALEEPHWVLLVAKLPDYVHRFFKPASPWLLTQSHKGYHRIVSSDGTPLVSIHDPWRDSDSNRGVNRQYRVLDRDHSQWETALLSAFCLVP